jgi:hypothetical protein
MIPATPVGSHMSVLEIDTPTNKHIGWLTAEGKISLDPAEAIPYGDKNIMRAQNLFYNNSEVTKAFLWPTTI